MARFPMESRTWHLTPRGWLEVAEPPPDRAVTLVGTKYEEEGWNEGMTYWECETVWRSPAADRIAALYDQFGQRPPHPEA